MLLKHVYCTQKQSPSQHNLPAHDPTLDRGGNTQHQRGHAQHKGTHRNCREQDINFPNKGRKVVYGVSSIEIGCRRGTVLFFGQLQYFVV